MGKRSCVLETEVNMQKQAEPRYIYRVGNINFIVTPIYRDKCNETIFTILLKLMKAEVEQNKSH